MVMTLKKTTNLNISVAESEAKLDTSACHPVVGGEATTTLMPRWLILAIYFITFRIALLHKLSAQQAVKQPSTRIDQSTPYSSPEGISRSTYTDHAIAKRALLSIKQGKPEEVGVRWVPRRRVQEMRAIKPGATRVQVPRKRRNDQRSRSDQERGWRGPPKREGTTNKRRNDQQSVDGRSRSDPERANK
jgi:hypothetical protein